MGYEVTEQASPLHDDVLARTRANVVLFAHRDDRPVKRIGVSLSGRANIPLMTRVANALAQHDDAEVVYLSVVPDSLSEAALIRARDTQIQALRRHTRAVPYSATLIRADDVMDALLEQSASFDMMLVGAASTGKANASVGTFSSVFASRAACSVVVCRAAPSIQPVRLPGGTSES